MSQAVEDSATQERATEYCFGCGQWVDRDGHADGCDEPDVCEFGGDQSSGSDGEAEPLTGDFEAMQEHLVELAETNQQLRDRVDQLEESVNHLEQRLDAGRKQRESMKSLLVRKEITDEDREFISDNGPILDQLQFAGRDAPIQELKSQLEDEQKMRSQSIALLRKELENLVSELDVNVDDDDIAEDDKIARVRQVGLEDLVDGRITATERRAEQLLQDVGEVGDFGRAPIGRLARISSPQAQEYFAEKHDEELNSVQVRRVFEQIEDWGGASPRSVKIRKSDGTNTLHLGLRDQEEV